MSTAKAKIPIFNSKTKQERDYWMQKLSAELGESSPRPDFRRPASSTAEKGAFELDFPDELSRKVAEVAVESPFLIYTLLLAALQICLGRYTGSASVVVGSPARRAEGDAEQESNALAIVTSIDRRATFKTLLMGVRETLIEAYANQTYPFERILRDLASGRPGAEDVRSLFGVSLALEQIHSEMPEVRHEISIRCSKAQGKISGVVEFERGLYKQETVERFIGHWLNILRAALNQINDRVGSLDMLSDAERRRMLVEWNETRAGGDERVRPFHQLFAEQAARTPGATALTFGDERLTYAELNERANRLAHYLRRRGVGPERLVAVCVERSIEMMVAVLGVLKAGAAYVPLDPTHPQERLAYMIDDARASVLLTQRELAPRVSAITAAEVICLDADWEAVSRESGDNPSCGATPDNLAYVIYTSGSTGRPKGVLVSHRGLGNLAATHERMFRTDAESRILQFASLGFDASVAEICTAFSTGAALCLGSRESLTSAQGVRELMLREGVTTATLPPALLSVLDAEGLPALKTVAAAGESCSQQIVERWSRGRRFLNAYGPTESSVCVTIMECDPARDGAPPIGRPLDNITIYILDEELQPVPVGVAGELYIGGIGLARGYQNRPDLTAERFIPDPFSEEAGARLYRTGDLSRYLDDGNIEFLGRTDHQVKLRGYRIEPGEVEAALRRAPSVRDALVMAREDAPGDVRLVAYLLASRQEAPSVHELREFLKRDLPDYMIPAAFVTLEEFPRTPNGKVNRKALPPPEHGRGAADSPYVAPRTPVEEVIAGFWFEVLGGTQVGVNDNFFESGGHSLLATQVVSRIREAFGLELPLGSLFESPTIAGLSRLVESGLGAGGGAQVPPVVAVSRAGELPLSFAQQRLWFLHQLDPRSSAYHIHVSVRLAGRLDVPALEQTLTEIVRRHEALRTTFEARGGLPRQRIHAPAPFRLEVADLSGLASGEREAEAVRLATDSARRPFDLSSGPPLRVKLIRLGAEEHVAAFTMHHIVSDGWSMGVLVREVAALYAAFRSGEPSPLPELPVQYADFAAWQREQLMGEALERQLTYWRGRLAGMTEVLELPTDRERTPERSHRGATAGMRVGAEVAEGLRELSRRSGVTLYMTLLAAFQTLLQRYTGRDDIAVGTDIANRNRSETEGLIGFFVNQLVMRTDLAGDPTFTELLARVRETALGAYGHQDLPFETLVHDLQPERDLNRSPLFQVKFILQNARMQTLELPGLTISPVGVARATTPFEFVLSMTEAADGLAATATYATELYDESTIRRLLERFETLLGNIVADPDARLSGLRLLSDDAAGTLSPSDFPDAGLSKQDFENLLLELTGE